MRMIAAHTRSLRLTHRALTEKVLKQSQIRTAPSLLKRYMSSEKSVEQETVAKPNESVVNATETTKTEAKLLEKVETISKQLETLKTKQDELMDKYKRALADSENLRVRLNKQIADAKVYGIQSFCKDLLEVADILGHATQSVPLDEINDSNPHLKSLYGGLTMTKSSLLQVFKRHGLVPMDPLNEKFDPNFHEALFQKDEPGAEPNTVVSVTKLGYKLHDRCIRPALVGVSKSS